MPGAVFDREESAALDRDENEQAVRFAVLLDLNELKEPTPLVGRELHDLRPFGHGDVPLRAVELFRERVARLTLA